MQEIEIWGDSMKVILRLYPGIFNIYFNTISQLYELELVDKDICPITMLISGYGGRIHFRGDDETNSVELTLDLNQAKGDIFYYSDEKFNEIADKSGSLMYTHNITLLRTDRENLQEYPYDSHAAHRRYTIKEIVHE